MKNKIIILMLAILLSINFITAQSYIFKQNEYVNFRFRCINTNNEYCISSTLLMINVEYPNGSNALDNKSMTFNPTYYNVSLPTDTIGVGYKAIIISPTVNGTVTEFTYDISYTGEHMTTTQTSIYILGIVILILFMLGLSYIIFQLPNSDSMDDSNNILQISQLKHVRSILWVIIWGIGLAIIFMLSNLSLAYLTNKMIGNLFFGFYRIMFYVTLVGIPVYTMFILYRAFQDREFQNMLNRGAELRGQP